MRAMVELARVYGRGPKPLHEVARIQNISVAYLEQIVALLRQAGLVESTRGAYGGYSLARKPEAITVGQIVRALEGPIAPRECVAEVRDSDACGLQDECSTRLVWKKMRDGIKEALDSTTLADLLTTHPPA